MKGLRLSLWHVPRVLVLRPSFVPEKVGVDKK